MPPWILFLLLAAALAFDQWSTGNTLRFDYYHSGTAEQEHVSLHRIRAEGPWPGSRTQLLDDSGLGKYRFEVRDLRTQTTLYTRGFASIYGEWETTGEARAGVWRTFHESQRFPEPRDPVQLLLHVRVGNDGFREIFSCTVDPRDHNLDRSPLSAAGEVWSVQVSGDPSTKVDLLVLGDGYTQDELPKYRADVRRMVEALFATEPFASRRNDFNVWGIDLPSTDSGISRPRSADFKRTPLGLSFNAFDSDRYLLSFANEAMREVAANAPYDAIMMIGNTRKYGGGGIFNLYATTASDNAVSAYVFVHEMGHSFAGLADEYYTSQVAYEEFTPAGVEPWEPNVTALLDPRELKWAAFVEAETPLPTPWDQVIYDEISIRYQERRAALRAADAPEEAVEALFAEEKAQTTPMLRAERWFGTVGAFEGAHYEAKGMYRPEVDCIMFTRNPRDFCRVCRAAIERVIDLYAR